MKSLSMITLLALSIGLAACSDDDDGTSLDAQFAAAMSSLEKATGDLCACLSTPDSAVCQAQPDECYADAPSCTSNWMIDAEYQACTLAALKADEAKAATALACIDSAVTTMQSCVDGAACDEAVLACSKGYETDSQACLVALGTEIVTEIQKCSEEPEVDASQPSPDSGPGDDASSDDASADDASADDAASDDAAA